MNLIISANRSLITCTYLSASANRILITYIMERMFILQPYLENVYYDSSSMTMCLAPSNISICDSSFLGNVSNPSFNKSK